MTITFVYNRKVRQLSSWRNGIKARLVLYFRILGCKSQPELTQVGRKGKNCEEALTGFQELKQGGRGRAAPLPWVL